MEHGLFQGRQGSVSRTQESRCTSTTGRGFDSVPVHSGGEALTEESLSIMEDSCSLGGCDNAKIDVRFGEE